jgi:hypothetical protein
MKITGFVEENYKRFCKLEGSDYIATGFALSVILWVIRKFKVNSVLELGLGIGAIADTVLKDARIEQRGVRYVGTESNEFCNRELKKNIEFYSDLEHYNRLSEVPNGETFDLIIVDGMDSSFEQIKSHCKLRSIIFIEGDRTPQANLIMSLFPKAKHVNVISLEKHKIYAHGNPQFFIGGGRLIFTDPTLQMHLVYWKLRISTYFKRILRKFL